MRIAFLTDEYVTCFPERGGLASYLERITSALKKAGHTPEIFVCNYMVTAQLSFEHSGILVHHLPAPRGFLLRWLLRTERFFLKTPLHGVTGYLAIAWTLSKALERRQALVPFDAVQYPNTSASGLFVRRTRGRRRINRLSSHRMMWLESEGLDSLGAPLLSYLERKAAMHAEFVYAPSTFLANACGRLWRRKVLTVRPPMDSTFLPGESDLTMAPPFDRYLVHFGQIGRRKGSDVLAEALVLAWEQEPALRMIWAGSPVSLGNYERYAALWGQQTQNVLWLGALSRKEVLSIVRHAIATVAPSRADNLPNTVIESLMLGVPVIGTAGASIDELVEDGLSGRLIPPDDPQSLANALVSTWRGEPSWLGEGFKAPSLISEMTEDAAIQGILELLRISNDTSNGDLE